MRAHSPARRDLVRVPYDQADRLLAQGWTIAPEEDHNRVIGWVYLERGGTWSLTRGWGCAALVSAALWLAVAGLAWWVLHK